MIPSITLRFRKQCMLKGNSMTRIKTFQLSSYLGFDIEWGEIQKRQENIQLNAKNKMNQ